jgi:fructose-1,6-bisphosphatase-3
MTSNHHYNESDKHYLQLLSQSFPTIADAAKEIINLEAIMNLPKGTEHFLADLHGESEAFQHVLKNASGNIKRKVNELFGNTIRESEKKELCTLIYYPEEKLELIKAQETDLDDWYRITIHQLVRVCRDVSSKYTRSKVRKSLPEDFSYIIEELLHERTDDIDKAAYVAVIVNTIISTGRADDFICAICNVIQRLSIDQLHILGDIYDRGAGAHKIMDTLRQYHSWDIQWGNHDILWMGASAGNDACICNVLRLCLRYANLSTIEEYGINLVPLATFALEVYGDDPCEEFLPRLLPGNEMDEKTRQLTAKMHKAIAVLQLKAEAQIFKRHPEWQMEDRCLFEHVDYTRGVCELDGREYEMRSCHFPTVDPANPNQLTDEEALLMQKLHHSFRISEKLHKHIRTMLSHGCMYAIHNSNLLFHASIPLNDDGSLKEVEIYPGKKYSGKDLMHNIGMLIRAAFQNNSSDTQNVGGDLLSPTEEYPREYARDYFLYLWCGKDSPLFDKSKMATFERYFLKDEETFKEEKGNYFKLRNSEEVCDRILDAFEVKGDNRHIINGHVPVHASKGENPIKAGGRLMVIDGGFSEAYHKETGIAGYTLVYHSRGFQLVQHEPFTSARDAIVRETDIKSTKQIVEMSAHRILVADTDKGEELRAQVRDLKELLYAYRHGIITEKRR